MGTANWRKRAGSAVRRCLPTAVQILVAAGLAVLVAELVGFDKPIGAPLFAVTTLEFVCARHRRQVAIFFFGLGFGLAIAAVAAGYRSLDRVVLDFVVGVAVAMIVAFLTTPRDPTRRLNSALEPVLTNLTLNIRHIASALRTHDVDLAREAVYSLADTEEDLLRVREVMMSVRRSAAITLWTTGRDLEAYATTAAEIGFAVRNIRVMARHAWWGVLKGGESVPIALPPMLEALSDGVCLVRDELRRGGTLRMAQPQLVSAARWIDVMREERHGMASAAVAADADAAVLNLLVATGIPVAKADAMLNHSMGSPERAPAAPHWYDEPARELAAAPH